MPPFPGYVFQPNFYVDITDYLSRKIRAMEAYVREMCQFPHPRSATGIEVLAQKRGMEVGFQAAEAFMLIREEWV